MLRSLRSTVLPLLAGLGLAASASAQAPMDTHFMYQGRLTNSGSAASGNFDFECKLFSDAGGVTQVGSTVTLTNVSVSNGLFTLAPDFGGQFKGNKTYLSVGVRPAGGGTFTPVGPLQEIAASPVSLFSLAPWISNPSTGGISFPVPGGFSVGTLLPAEVFGVSGPTNSYGLAHTDGTITVSTFLGGQNVIAGWLGTVSNHPLAFFTNNGSARMIIGTNGNVGIGTTAPGYKLHVVGTSADTFPFVVEYNGSSPGNAVRGVVNAGASGNFSSGVTGINAAPAGPSGGFGMYAEHTSNGTGIRAISATGNGVEGLASNAAGRGGYFKNTAGGVALLADGIAQVKALQILGGADVAEPFDVNASASAPEQAIEPGMVVSIDEVTAGDLRLADRPYDTKVAGVISGANGLAPGMVLKSEGDAKADGRHPVAMAGRVWVWCDARPEAGGGSVRLGDRLTTSATPGHAMRVDDTSRAPGAVIGKAMTELKEGKGLVLVLVNLQ